MTKTLNQTSVPMDMANELFSHAYQQLHKLLPNTVCFFIDNTSTWFLGEDADTIHRLFAIPYTYATNTFQITILDTTEAVQLIPAITAKGRRIYIVDLRTVLFHSTDEKPFSPLQPIGKTIGTSEFSQPLMLKGMTMPPSDTPHPQPEQKDYYLSTGLKIATQYLTQNFIASCCGIGIQGIAAYTQKEPRRFFNQNNTLHKYNYGIRRCAQMLLDTKLEEGPQSALDSPLFYGLTFIEKFRVLGKFVKIPFLFENVMGKSYSWRSLRLYNKQSNRFNHFTNEELEEVRQGLHVMANDILTIHFIPDEIPSIHP